MIAKMYIHAIHIQKFQLIQYEIIKNKMRYLSFGNTSWVHSAENNSSAFMVPSMEFIDCHHITYLVINNRVHKYIHVKFFFDILCKKKQ